MNFTDLEVEFEKGPSDTVAIAGLELTMTCQPPESVPPPTIMWYKDSAPLALREGQFAIELEPNGDLHFASVQLEDAGKYVCVAFNTYAYPKTRTSLTASITVEGQTFSELSLKLHSY